MASSSSADEPSLAQIAQRILQDAIDNTIHDIILDRHRQHKTLLTTLDPTSKLPLCDRCGLPRLLDPPLAPSVRGATSEPPGDTQYCEKRPWCRKPGFDIYGNPFLKADLTGRPPTKKEREAAKNTSGKKGEDGTPASNEGGDGTAPPSPEPKLEKGEKKASKIDEKLKKGEYIPWQTCPNCKRSLLITRFAKHLEACMGLSGRAASRNAMAKMNGNGTGSGAGGTPAGSRSGTPVPSGSQEAARENGGEDEDEDEKIKGPGGVRKKVLKKGLNSKLKKDSKAGNGSGKPRPPSSSAAAAAPPSSAGGESSKRDLDEMLLGDDGDDEDNVHVKKRQKLQRVESTVSLDSAGTAMERVESMQSLPTADKDVEEDLSSFLEEGSFEDD